MGIKSINTARIALLDLFVARGLSLAETQPDASPAPHTSPVAQIAPRGIHPAPGRWDEIYREAPGNRPFVWKDGPTPWLIAQTKRLKRDGIQSIMDAGCGDGRNAIALAKLGFTVTAIDQSSEAIARLNRNANGIQGLASARHSLDRLPYVEYFDAIVCDFVLVHISNGEEVIANFHSALKPKGLLLAEFLSNEDPSYGKGKKVGDHAFMDRGVFHRYYDREGIAALLEQFNILSIDQITHTDPAHTKSFPRSKPHQHNSFYVVARKR